MDKWDENAEARKKIGDESEIVFTNMVACKCGGKFTRYANTPGQPDFRCESCGQLVDVKSSPVTNQTGNITVSARPWHNYTDSTLVAAMVDYKWLGNYKKNISVTNPAPYVPAHSSTNTVLKNTPWYKITCSQLKTLESLGYHITYQEYMTVKLDDYNEAMSDYVVIGSSWPYWSSCPIVTVRKA